MEQMKMSMDVLLTPSNVDMSERWRYSSMMVAMQELAEIHAASFGNSRAQLIEKGVVWVLARARIETSRVPKMGETIRLTTWPGQTVRALFPRYYSMEDEAGRSIGTAVTLWMLVDVEKHRMAMASAAGVTMPDASGLPVPQPNPGKLAMDGEPEVCFRRCAYSDLDVNHHMNNTRYYDLAESCIGGETESLRLCSAATEFVSE